MTSSQQTRPEAGGQNGTQASPWAIMAPVRGQIGLAIALSVLSGLCGLTALALCALALRDAMHMSSSMPSSWPWRPLAGALAATLCAYVLRLSAFDQSHYAAFRLETILRTGLARHLSRVSLGDVEAMGTGALTKVMHDDVKELHVFVADSTPFFARAYAMPVFTFCILLWLDWRLALAALLVLLAGFGVLALAMRDRTEMTRRYNAARERVSASVVEYVQAMPVVRTFDTGETTFGRYQRALDAYRDMLTGWYRAVSFTARFSLAALNPMPTVAVLVGFGAILFAQGTLDFASWVAVLLLGTGMAEAVMPLMMLNHMVEKSRQSIARIRQVMDLPEQCVQTPAPHPPADAGIVFDHVHFRYEACEDEVLHDLSFTAAPGSVTALVGPSGAGKSTVVRLIPRFRDVTGGRILVGGVDVRQMEPDMLMAHMSFVFQDCFLFAGTVAENIRLGCPEADGERMMAAARAAQAHDFIMKLPSGYDTRIGEHGTFLSGGQRQRLAIARAILEDRPILVLDEATAFADPESEGALVRALASLMQGRTVIIVAHRLETIRGADQILVLDRGRLVERGKHEDLIAHGGLYARLWADHEQAAGWTMRATRKTGTAP